MKPYKMCRCVLIQGEIVKCICEKNGVYGGNVKIIVITDIIKVSASVSSDQITTPSIL
jgi:hypothetical protein